MWAIVCNSLFAVCYCRFMDSDVFIYACYCMLAIYQIEDVYLVPLVARVYEATFLDGCTYQTLQPSFRLLWNKTKPDAAQTTFILLS